LEAENMLRSFRARNFRCFQDTEVKELAGVNLFIGKNNVGKTSLLEALFLHAGPNNPDLPMALNFLRGISQFELNAEEIWGWLFTGRRLDGAIELRGVDKEGKERILRIQLGSSESTPISTPSNGKPGPARSASVATTALGPRNLLLHYEENGKALGTSRALILADGPQPTVKLEPAAGLAHPLALFLTPAAQQLVENVERFSRLQDAGQEQDLLKALQVLEPRLTRLAVSVKGGVPVIQGEIGMPRLVPFPFLGAGMGRLLSYLLAIASAPKGAVFIDEAENGFHYTALPRVWSAVADFAQHYETQVFATSHSDECIAAAHRAFAERLSYDFSLHRLDRVEGKIAAIPITREILETAEARNLEVR
jgi:hypothetical protein